MQLSESLIGILEVECGVGRLWVIEDVKVCKFSLFVGFTWNTWGFKCPEFDIDQDEMDDSWAVPFSFFWA